MPAASNCRLIVTIAWLAIVVMHSCSTAAPRAANVRRPNFLIILADDLGYRDLGFMGNSVVRTPNIDVLARESARFVNGYVPHSVCRPSLATILTGLYPHQHGIYFNHPPPGLSRLREMTVAEWIRHRSVAERFIREVPTIPRILASRGYACLQTGKHWEGDYRNAGFTHGMTQNKASNVSYGNYTLRDGVVAHGNGDAGLAIGRDTLQPIFDFVLKHKDSPFLVWYAPLLPHQPFNADRRFRMPYEEHGGLPEYLIDYYAEISRFDDTVGKLLRFFEEQSLMEETFIVVASDNGFRPAPKKSIESSGRLYDTRSKLSPYEDGVRTPILVYWHERTVPAKHTELVHTIDIMPTVLAAADADHAANDLPGVNLLPAAMGKSSPPTRPAFGEIYANDAASLQNPGENVTHLWVRDGDLKLIRRVGRPADRTHGSAADVELFDLSKDSSETHNVAKSPAYAAQLARLQRLLDSWWQPEKAVATP